MKIYGILMFLCFGNLWLRGSAEQCGRQADGALCPNGLCCSSYGWCGTTEPWCGEGCQSQCWYDRPPPPSQTPPPPSSTPPPPPSTPGGEDISDIISANLFNQMLLHRNDPRCLSNGFYTYDAFINAAHFFYGFAITGDETTRKRELAAFLAQTSHETTGGWPTAEDGPYAWGYCFIEEVNAVDPYCSPSLQWPCVPDKKYYGRGPIQLSYNYNYGQAGAALALDLLKYPELVATNSLISFETAFWFWMTPQGNKPSSHDVITGKWQPSNDDIVAGRVPGYGVITNIINGGVECGHGPDDRVKDRIGFYKRYCDMLGIDYGDNLDCYDQKPFNSGVKLSDQM